MRQKHDQNHQGQLDDGGRGVNKETFFEMVDEWGLQDAMEMWWLQTNIRAQQIEDLDSMLRLEEQVVQRQQKVLRKSV